MKRTSAALALAAALLAAACSSAEPATKPAGPEAAPAATTTTVPVTTTSTTVAPPATTTETVSPLAAQVSPIGSAAYDPAEHSNDAPVPTSISIDEINVANAPVVDVGVEDNGDMELPGAEAVGWYRYNAIPGEDGSSVLSAHISYNGTNGVFRYLSDVEPGDVVTIGYNDGSAGAFEVVEVAQYDKQELPLDRIFDKDGAPVLTLITCGGDFNSSLRSYEDNFVAYAVPIDA